MERRNFIKNSSLAAAGILATPYILPSGSLFAKTGQRKVNHVVLCLLGGGLRNTETVYKAEGNLMPNTFFGKEAISQDLSPDVSTLDAQLEKPLQAYGTLFKKFSYKQGALGHFNAHAAVLTGQYYRHELSHQKRINNPTIFEYHRKSQSPFQSGLKSWNVSNPIAPYPSLTYSLHPEFGEQYATNWLCSSMHLDEAKKFFPQHHGQMMDSYTTPIWDAKLNTEAYSMRKMAEKGLFDRFNESLNSTKHLTEINTDWYLPVGHFNQDLITACQAGKVLDTFNPELLVVNMQEMDIAHSNFTKYCDKITKADFALAKLWKKIQQNPKMADNTLMIVLPDHGRNAYSNDIMDHNGRFGLDHSESDSCRDIFCLILGPDKVVKQNVVIDSDQAQSIDILPTIAHALGFYSDLEKAMLQGRVMQEAFI